MTSDDGGLYQKILLAHARSPRRRGPSSAGAQTLHGVNTLCGDEVSIHLVRAQGGKLDGTFESEGCAICRASASILMDTVAGKDEHEVARIIDSVLAAVRGGPASGEPVELGESGEDIAALLDLRAYPARQRCVTLAWETLRGGLSG